MQKHQGIDFKCEFHTLPGLTCEQSFLKQHSGQNMHLNRCIEFG